MCQISCAVCHLGTTLHTGFNDLHVDVLCIGPSARDANDFFCWTSSGNQVFFNSFFQNIAALQRFVLRLFMLCGKKAKSRPTKPLDPINGPIFWVTDLLKQHCFRKSRQVLPLPDLTPRYACGPTWPTFKPLIWGISYRDPSDFAVWPTATFSTFLNYICVI